MKFKIIVLLLAIIFFGINISFAGINLSISPIKYELEGTPGEIIKKTAKLYNYSDNDITIITGKSDFIASGNDGSPKFVRYSELVHLDQQLSSWIKVSSDSFIIHPKETKVIDFQIKIPKNATPGGHYGAVFFKNNNSEESSTNGASVGINVDYGVLILLKVKGKIITNIEIENENIGISRISNGGSTKSKNKENSNSINYLENGYIKKDKCFVDFTNSDTDGKCFHELDNIIDIIIGNNKYENNKIISTDIVKDEDFNISFTIPVNNKGNTHIKTYGEISLFDENGKQIKQIGKKIITNDKGTIIGENIVDYIPINDTYGNVLPGTKRIFKPQWQGFPYKERDDEGNIIIKYENPSNYYSEESVKKDFRLMPWEKIKYSEEIKKITAKFNISYKDDKGEGKSFPSAQDFDIFYTKKYIGLNYYILIPIIFIIFLFLLLWIITLSKRKKCRNKKCRKKIKKKLKNCPYCGEKQKNKKK